MAVILSHREMAARDCDRLFNRPDERDLVAGRRICHYRTDAVFVGGVYYIFVAPAC